MAELLLEDFKNEGYALPRPLISALGKPLIFWIMDAVLTSLGDDDEVLVIAQELHTVQVSLMDRFRARYGSRVRLVTISFETRGWVET